MTFIRPEITAAFARNRRELLAAVGVLLGLWLLIKGWNGSDFLAIGAGIALAGLAAALWWADRLRAGFRRQVAAPGLVQITEARIAYFGPQTGSFIDRDALQRVDLIPGGSGPQRWVFHAAGQPPVSIPLAAEGADQLVDLLAGLPGARTAVARAALASGETDMVRVWTRG